MDINVALMFSPREQNRLGLCLSRHEVWLGRETKTGNSRLEVCLPGQGSPGAGLHAAFMFVPTVFYGPAQKAVITLLFGILLLSFLIDTHLSTNHL